MLSESYIQLDFFESENATLVKIELNQLRTEVGKIRRGVFQRLSDQKKQINNLAEEIHYLRNELAFLRYNLKLSKDENLVVG